MVICGVGWAHDGSVKCDSTPVEYGVRGEGYNDNNTGSGGQRGWEKCDSSIAVFLTQG